jgi:hypothetical protein
MINKSREKMGESKRWTLGVQIGHCRSRRNQFREKDFSLAIGVTPKILLIISSKLVALMSL